MTKTEALQLIAAYEADPDGFATCDNLCIVLDGLPEQPEEGEYTPEEVRSMAVEQLAEETMTYRNISYDGQQWIRDLMGAPGSAFPDIDPSDMTDTDRDALADYLREDDGSLSAEDLKFSAGVADEIQGLTR